jgi:Icc-related predicted phosphoesterase
MRLCLISDTHGLHDQLDLPEADVLVHAGDLLNQGKLSELNSASLWLQEQKKKFKDIVVIAGNHDFILQAFMTEEKEHILRKDFFPGMHYLRDSGATIDGVNFYGSPWQPWFYDWAFNAQRGPDIKKYWDMIPQDTDILVTHGPPKNILDRVGYQSVGCEELDKAIMRVRPEIHVFGHIHCGYGYKSFNGTEFYNAAVVNEAYEVVNKPWVVEI